MPRPRNERYVAREPAITCFIPRGGDWEALEKVPLAVEELEALRFVFILGLKSEEAAERMRVSRHTFGRILFAAQRAVSQALVFGDALCIGGGSYVLEETFPIPREEADKVSMIAAPVTGSSLDDKIHERFGRATGYLLVDTHDTHVRYYANTAGEDQSAGVDTAKRLAGEGVQLLLCGKVGPKALKILQQNDIAICPNLEGMTVREAIKRFKAGKLVKNK